MYIDDFVFNLLKVLDFTSNQSDVYNLCSGEGFQIKELLIHLGRLLPDGEDLLLFGVIPYRTNQNMYMVGNNLKFEQAFGEIRRSPIDQTLKKYISNFAKLESK